MADKKILETIKRWYAGASRDSGTWRDDAKEAYAFVAGDQWGDEDKKVLKEFRRPEITFNRTGSVVDSVVGLELNNRQEIRYLPRTPDDAGAGETMTAAIEWIRDNCDAEDEETDAFRDMVICGMGFVETRLDYDSHPDGTVLVERVDPGEMYWDNISKKRNLSDSRYVMRVRDIDLQTAQEMFPEADDSELNATWAHRFKTETHTQPHPSDAYEAGGEEKKPGQKVRLVECQWWEKEPYWRVFLPDGQAQELTVEEYKTAKERLGDLKAVKQTRKVYYRAFIGEEILEQGPAPCKHGFSYKCMTGKRDRNNNSWYGVIRDAKDPQKWANKWLSQALHILNTNAKGGIMMEADAVDDVRKFERDWADPGAVSIVNPGAISNKKIDRKPSAEMPTQLDRLMQFAVSSIRDTTGVNLELLGMADRQQAGILEEHRKQSAMTVLAPFFNSLRSYRKEQGRLLLYFVQEYISDDRLIRVVGPQGAKDIQLLRDYGLMEYDVIVDDTPSTPSQKEATWGTIGQILPMLVKLPLPPEFWLAIIDASPLVPSVAEKLKAAISAPQQNQGPPPEMMKMQAELQMEKEKAGIQTNVIQMKAKVDQMQAQQKMQIAQAELELEVQKAQLEMQIEAARANHEASLSKQKSDADIQIKQVESQARISMKHMETLAADKMLPEHVQVRTSELDNARAIVEGVGGGFESLDGSIKSVAAAIIDALNKPKEVVRDKAGRVVGVK